MIRRLWALVRCVSAIPCACKWEVVVLQKSWRDRWTSLISLCHRLSFICQMCTNCLAKFARQLSCKIRFGCDWSQCASLKFYIGAAACVHRSARSGCFMCMKHAPTHTPFIFLFISPGHYPSGCLRPGNVHQKMESRIVLMTEWQTAWLIHCTFGLHQAQPLDSFCSVFQCALVESRLVVQIILTRVWKVS